MDQAQAKLTAAIMLFYVRVLQQLRPHLEPAHLQEIASNATKIAVQYAKDHPYHSGFMALNIGLAPILGAGWLTAGVLKLIGFGPLGPIAGSLAAWYQSTFLAGYIPAGSLFAMLQRWGMMA